MVPLFGLLMLLKVLVHLVEVALVRFSLGVLAEWSPPDGFDAGEAASLMPGDPNVWTDGSLILDQVTGVRHVGRLLDGRRIPLLLSLSLMVIFFS